MKKIILISILSFWLFIVNSQNIEVLDKARVTFLYSFILNDLMTNNVSFNEAMPMNNENIINSSMIISKCDFDKFFFSILEDVFKIDSNYINLKRKKYLNYSKLNSPFTKTKIIDKVLTFKENEIVDKSERARISFSDIYYFNGLYYIFCIPQFQLHQRLWHGYCKYEISLCKKNNFPIFLARYDYLGNIEGVPTISTHDFKDRLVCDDDH